MDGHKVAILQAVLGNFDSPIDPVEQTIPSDFHRWTDDNFPPVMGLTPRLQYRIPKTHGWQMYPGYDYYIWMDGGISLQRPDCVQWYLDRLGDGDMAFFKHPSRRNIRQEVAHIEDHLDRDRPYISARYKNGLHREFLDRILAEGYNDRSLYASTIFIYKNTKAVQLALQQWWELGSRYFTCDQVQLPYVLHKNMIDVRILNEAIYKTGYMSMVSHHK